MVRVSVKGGWDPLDTSKYLLLNNVKTAFAGGELQLVFDEQASVSIVLRSAILKD